MRSILLPAMAMFAIMACGEGQQPNPHTGNADAASTSAAADNTLTSAEREDGFVLLFDGKSLAGWRTYQNKPATSWMVKDGVLYCSGDSANKSDMRADLVTAGEYENFDLSIDYKISPQGNSGIMYLVTEAYPAAYQTGPEYQIIDDKNFPEKLETWQMTGANYAMHPAPTAQPNPVGTWNTARIVKKDHHVEHWLNGKKLLEYELGSDDWKKRKAEGKWKDTPGYGTSLRGRIALQDHGSEAWFKNLKIKELQ